MGLKVVKLEPVVYRMHQDIYAGRRKTTALSEFGKSVDRGYVKVLENNKLEIQEVFLEIGAFTFILPFSEMPYITGFNI